GGAHRAAERRLDRSPHADDRSPGLRAAGREESSSNARRTWRHGRGHVLIALSRGEVGVPVTPGFGVMGGSAEPRAMLPSEHEVCASRGISSLVVGCRSSANGNTVWVGHSCPTKSPGESRGFFCFLAKREYRDGARPVCREDFMNLLRCTGIAFVY